MKKIFTLTVFVFAFSGLRAQCTLLTNAMPGYPAMITGLGDSSLSFTYSPLYNQYYFAGGNSPDDYVAVADVDGNVLGDTLVSNFYRNLWWNTGSSALEGWGYFSAGVQRIGLTAGTGLPLSTSTFISNPATNVNQTDAAYDAANDYLLMYYNGVISRFSKSTGALINNLTITGLPVSLSNLNINTCFYTGCPGKAYGVFDKTNRRAYLINENTGAYVGASQLPNIAPNPQSGGVCYANGMLWLQDTAWKSYYILGNTPTVISDSFHVYTNLTCAGTHFYFQTTPYYSNSTVKTYFGDGDTSLTPILPGGYAVFTHLYPDYSTFTVKHVFFSGAYYNGTLPIDSVSYTYESTMCNWHGFRFYHDLNGNNIMDSNESYLLTPVLLEVDSNNIPIDTLSGTSKIVYSEKGNFGDIYKFKLLAYDTTLSVTSPNMGIIVDTMHAFDTLRGYFGFTCNTNEVDLRVYTTGLTGKHAAHYNIFAFNASCIPSNVTQQMSFSPKYSYSSSSLTPFAQTGNLLSWNFNGLINDGTVKETSTFFGLPPGASQLAFGDTVNTDYVLSPVSGDINPSNNYAHRDDTIKSGYDPNEMWVSPQGDIAPGTQLKYTIQFENTGNAPAENIYVMDTLSDNVDIRSLRLVMASATMNTAYLQSGGHNIVKFDFPNIHLLDSSHHGQCDGLVIFNVNAKHGLPIGTTIFNHAGIFFDDNPVVMTDTVEDIIGMQESVKPVANVNDVKLYPNPASDVLTVNMDKVQYSGMTITNSVGQEVLQQTISNAKTNIDISKLPAGVYYVMLTGTNGKNIKKFSKI